MKKFLKNKKLLVILAVVAVVVVSALLFIKSKGSNGDMEVSTTKVQMGDITSDVIVSGTIKSSDEVEINSELEAAVKEVLVKEGQQVKKGDVLARLETDVLKSRVESAQIDLDIQRRELADSIDGTAVFRLEKESQNKKIESENAKRGYDNAKELHKNGAVSEDELKSKEQSYISANNAYEVAIKEYEDEKNGKNMDIKRNNVKLKEIDVKLAQDQLDDAFIKSPIDGTIVYSNCKVGIDARDQKPMFVIHDMGSLQVHASISQFDIYKVKIGQEVAITGDAFPESTLKGKVSYIAPSAMEDKNGSGKGILVKVDMIDPPANIKTGFSADIDIVTEKSEGVIALPYESILQNGDGKSYVFKVKNGSLEKVDVELGIEGDLAAQVISDKLNEGDIIATNPNDGFEDGMRVAVKGNGND
ncbi:RND family efflux transporter, MFP subunit [Peptoclostridium litorale DSM 5388]|uniref:Putative HlyD family secretion protein n=1 Tax=Peptoclostridium litorale DSM 5388 TaxID=1121324 RepID=A0A069RHD6_PEPLI|nr:efflux RND transporter periplasmic adaptor subunit [Peptoclostridium litorale]KDR96459.1 putative HlyD family secretion protein [Peptoclostridium litorale DSM 5388]SIN70341.1 RND family efflux transporter, MFP subunit [Peptoclostridium litorale DSM 5388]